VPSLRALHNSLTRRGHDVARRLKGAGTPVQGLLPWFLLAALVYLYLTLFILPDTPIWRGGDQSIPLLNAMWMLEGRVIYRDFFQFALPGTELVYFTLLKLLGLRAWIPNATLLFLGISLTWLSITLAEKVMSGWASVLPALLFLTFGFNSARDTGHHWFSVLAVMAAVAVVIEERTPARLIWAGALCGLASFFTQTRGVVAVTGFAVFLLWQRLHKGQSWTTLLKDQTCLLAPFVGTSLATSAYFVWRAGPERFVEDTVIFGIRYYPAYSMANGLKVYLFSPPDIQHWYNLPGLGVYLFIHLLVPGAYVIFLLRYRREVRSRSTTPWDRLMLLNMLGLFLFLGVASAPSFFRLCTVSLPALILAVWLGASAGKPERFLAGLLWTFALMLVVIEPLRAQQRLRVALNLPAGPTAFSRPVWHEKYKWVRDHTLPSDFFFEGVWSDVYFPLHLRNPAAVPFVTATDYTRPEQVQNVLEALQKHRVKFVLWSLELDTASIDRPAGDHLGPLRAYLRTHYQVVESFEDGDQVWERIDDRAH